MSVRYNEAFMRRVAEHMQTGLYTFGEVAKRYKLHAGTVSCWTRKYAEPRWKISSEKVDLVSDYINFNKTPPIIALSDADIAIDVGLTVDAVRYLRLSFGAVHKKRSLYIRKGKVKKDNKKAPTLPPAEIQTHLFKMFRPLAERYRHDFRRTS